MKHTLTTAIGAAAGILWITATAFAQPPASQTKAPASPTKSPQPPAQATATPTIAAIRPPADYVIGPEDVLMIVFWREKDLSAEAVVRPDGKISLPLINEVQAAGLTPDQLREKVLSEAARFIEEPSATIVVKQINSRKVFITGQVGKPGPYPLMAPTTVVQLIAMAGGLNEFADSKHIVIMRAEGGRQITFPFNYKSVAERKNLRQNIELKPGDTIIVP